MRGRPVPAAVRWTVGHPHRARAPARTPALRGAARLPAGDQRAHADQPAADVRVPRHRHSKGLPRGAAPRRLRAHRSGKGPATGARCDERVGCERSGLSLRLPASRGISRPMKLTPVIRLPAFRGRGPRRRGSAPHRDRGATGIPALRGNRSRAGHRLCCHEACSFWFGRPSRGMRGGSSRCLAARAAVGSAPLPPPFRSRAVISILLAGQRGGGGPTPGPEAARRGVPGTRASAVGGGAAPTALRHR